MNSISILAVTKCATRFNINANDANSASVIGTPIYTRAQLSVREDGEIAGANHAQSRE